MVIFSAKILEIMSEADAASPANLEDERDELKFELTILQGRLKHEFDFSMMLGPLLADTAPATIEGNARLGLIQRRNEATPPQPPPGRVKCQYQV